MKKIYCKRFSLDFLRFLYSIFYYALKHPFNNNNFLIKMEYEPGFIIF